MIDKIMESIKGFLGSGADEANIHNKISEGMQSNQPAPLKQPMAPDALTVKVDDDMFNLDTGQLDVNTNLPGFMDETIDPDVDADEEAQSHENAVDRAMRAVTEGWGGVTRNKSQANGMYMDIIKKHENPGNKGLTNVNGVPTFMMFKSQYEKKEEGQSEFEIGYGIKVQNAWLSDSPDKWMKINDIPVDVRKGLTMQQTEDFLKSRMRQDRKDAKANLPTWGNMTEEEKMGWQDLTYNGGSGLLQADSQAKAAATAGYTMEGLAKLSHFTRAGTARYRGLLSRRLNMYNHAALSVSGAPVIEEYTWGPNGIRIKFSSDLISDKFSPSFKKKVSASGGWYDVPGQVKDKEMKSFKINDDYQFGE